MNLATFKAAALRPDVGVRFYAQIQGIPYVFLSGDTPVGPSGAEWAAPTSGGFAYTLLERSLDQEASPIRDIGAKVTRSKSAVSSASLALVLRESRADALLSLFARHRTTGARSNLIASVGYDTGGTGVVNLDVESTSAWSSPSFLYMGRETMRVTTSTSTRLISSARDLFDELGNGDGTYRHNDSRAGSPREVADHPRVWHGRYVRVFMHLVGHDGTAFDDAFGGDYAIEVWRGTLDGNPIPSRDRLSWEIRTSSIERVLQTQVGFESMRGSLMQTPPQHNAAGASLAPPGVSPTMLMYLDENSAYLHFTVRQWAARADYEDGLTPTGYWDHMDGVALSDALAPRIMTFEQLVVKYQQVRDQVLSDTSDELLLKLGMVNGVPYLRSMLTTGTKHYQVDLDFTRPGSVGPQLGFIGLASVGTHGVIKTVLATGPISALYIPDNAKYLPVFLDPEEGAGEEPPSSGYARIGEGETAEIVSYEAISAMTGEIGDILRGYYLEGVQRGRLGTRPRTVAVPLGEAEGGENARITFGVGWQERPALEILLELATSTGEGHHGDWDVLPPRVSTPLQPSHFDVDAFARAIARLSPIERSVSWFLAKPEKLSEMMSGWLQPHGRYLHACTTADGTYRITVGEVAPPLQSEIAATIDATALDFRDPEQFQPGASEVVNVLRVFYRWDFGTGEQDEKSQVLVSDLGSSEEHGRTSELEWKLRGVLLEPSQARALVFGLAQEVFARYGRPYDILRIPVGRLGWFLKPGDTVQLDLAYVPSTSGVRGLEQLATVLQVEKGYSRHRCLLELVMESPDRVSTYVPSARVTAYDSGVPSITLSSSSFSGDGELDYENFDASDVIWVYLDEADASTRVQRTIVSRTGAVCVLSSTVTGLVAGAGTLVTGGDYGAVQTSQRLHVHIAPNAGVFADAPTEAFRYA